MQFSSGKTKLFLDSGNPLETKQTLDYGFQLHGQTTNPSLVAKSPLFQERAAQGRITMDELFSMYKETVLKIAEYLPNGSISVEVYAGADSDADDLVSQARMMLRWLPNLHIKLPIMAAGLEAANVLVADGVNVNMTLCFTQEQAMAVHNATIGAKSGQVYVSPFIGRLDDKGQRGMDLIKNILQHYKNVDSHVQILAASIRSVEHVQQTIELGTDIMTVPFKIFDAMQEGNAVPAESVELAPIPFVEIDYSKPWTELNIQHDLTDTGLARFKKDWDDLLV